MNTVIDHLRLGSWFCLCAVCIVSSALALEPVDSDREAKSEDNAGTSNIDFNRDIRPIISGTCVACHGPDEETREAGLRLDTLQGATEDLGGYAAIVPGDPDASELILRIESDDEDLRMPPAGHSKPLDANQRAKLRQWIQAGADYAQHWSYAKPVKHALPHVQHPGWDSHPIDRFVLARLEQEGLQPSSESTRRELARRVALALTGLPPTLEQVEAFENDPSANAYERYVDMLLDSPAYGERWARVWLDLARYADSAGYADDPSRTIWAYRDYVIRSLNENKPFDQFTVEQIAGDLLDDPTDQQLIATAFHRNTMTNNEGGTNDEQFRNEAIVDRVNTTMAVWMGTTMACAQCHTHKYDPITQAEYFQFFDFFNQSQDADRRDESPLLQVFTDEQKSRKQELTKQITGLESVLQQQTPELDDAMRQWMKSLADPPNWNVWKPSHVSSDEVELTTESDGSIRLQGDRPAKATYRLQVPVEGKQTIAAMNVRVFGDQDSNFVLSRLTATYTPPENSKITGRFVRVELPGKNRILHLAEVQAFSAGENVAPAGKATQSSTSYNAPAQRASDGNTDGDFNNNSVTHAATEDDPWWEIDLGKDMPLDSIVVWNRTDGGQGIRERLSGYQISILDESRNVVWSDVGKDANREEIEHSVSGVRPLIFETAIADYSQQNFPAEAVIEGLDKGTPTSDDRGWAIAGGLGEPHDLTLILSEPIEASGGVIEVQIQQVSKFTEHLLTHFQLLATNDSSVTEWTRIPDDVRKLVRMPELSVEEQSRVAKYYRTIAPALQQTRQELATAKQQLEAIKPTTTVPIMRDLAAKDRRTTHIQIRGNYQSLSDRVAAGVPEVFHELPADLTPNRLALAKWLVSPENPLTARVIVNRHWEQIFGLGLVPTSEEFGSQGELPTHQELLDWLAVDLMENGWDLKRLLKQMVMSSTYRQSSKVTPEMLEVDPDNRFFTRGPRFRISAEMVRDQALQVSGLLSSKMYGPPVRPPQPSLGLTAAFGSKTDWNTSQGEDKYRRGIYTTWRRSNPYPSMATFDAPNREVCTIRRSRTNTPLQALVTLNDPVYVEAAQALARDVADRASQADQLREMFVRALQREPREEEQQQLERLYSRVEKNLSGHEEEARKLAEEPLGKMDAGLNAVQVASLTVVANAILNLDEMLMPR